MDVRLPLCMLSLCIYLWFIDGVAVYSTEL
jgi:hypothetical protein